MSHFRGLFALLPLAGQLLLPPSHVLAAPTLGDDGILSISARNIANNDLATHEGHPMMDNSVAERFPTYLRGRVPPRPRRVPDLPRFGWDVKNLVAELHYKTYHWLTNDNSEDEYAGFEHYVTLNWVCRTVTFKSNGGELMASHDFKEWGGGAIPVGVVSTTVMHNGPLHNELLTVRFGFAGKPTQWAAKPERTCNWGKQSNKKEEKCE
ncbi:hypothetical protein PG993_012261 [Apiospora rasikravindrae]|uniref:Uncharacterized protein n=1 Tax=Apiospora rasikravindrae TaxID=990691 RepID=A0ABR1S1W8_9PEZI